MDPIYLPARCSTAGHNHTREYRIELRRMGDRYRIVKHHPGGFPVPGHLQAARVAGVSTTGRITSEQVVWSDHVCPHCGERGSFTTSGGVACVPLAYTVPGRVFAAVVDPWTFQIVTRFGSAQPGRALELGAKEQERLAGSRVAPQLAAPAALLGPGRR